MTMKKKLLLFFENAPFLIISIIRDDFAFKNADCLRKFMMSK